MLEREDGAELKRDVEEFQEASEARGVPGRTRGGVSKIEDSAGGTPMRASGVPVREVVARGREVSIARGAPARAEGGSQK